MMSVQDFYAWRLERNLSVVDCSKLLGLSRSTLYNWELRKTRVGNVTLPIYVGLACAAVDNGLQPVGGRPELPAMPVRLRPGPKPRERVFSSALSASSE